MKRLILKLLLVALVLFPQGCSNNAKESKVISVGIISIIEHPFLEQARQGFIDGLTRQGYIEGKQIVYDYRNAYGRIDNANTIASAFIGNNVDIIYSIATPTTQAVKEKTSTIPIVFAAVTDPLGAKLVATLEQPGGNVTGVSDKIPVKYQLEIIQEILPQLKRLGVPYNAGEINSVSIINEMKEIAPGMGIEIIEATATSTADVAQAVSSLVDKSDAIYMPTDNTMAAAVEVISGICRDNKTPFFSSENETIQHDGALASLSVDHYKLGIRAAQMAGKILKGEAKPGAIPVEYLSEFEIIINMRVARKLGVNVTEGTQSKATLIE